MYGLCLGNDLDAPVRASGCTSVHQRTVSKGVVPFMKSQRHASRSPGGKRKGAVLRLLETFHIDVEEFLDLRKNTGTTGRAHALRGTPRTGWPDISCAGCGRTPDGRCSHPYEASLRFTTCTATISRGGLTVAHEDRRRVERNFSSRYVRAG